MKRYLTKTLCFLLASLIAILALLFLIPTTPKASTSLLMAENHKDSLLIYTPQKRIIFIGGSNLSFGLNSQTIKDSLNLNPINTAIHAGIGLKYMMDNSLRYIKEGDLCILVPEYAHFFRDYNYGSQELLRIVFDVNKNKIKLLSIRQAVNIIPFALDYINSKFQKDQYEAAEESEMDIYKKDSFNNYGDAYLHWELEDRSFMPMNKINEEDYEDEVMCQIKRFESKIKNKGAMLLISYPCLQDSSFTLSEKSINKVETEYIQNQFQILGSAIRYMMPDSLMFDTPYHLNKSGVDRRTHLLIEDIKNYFSK